MEIYHDKQINFIEFPSKSAGDLAAAKKFYSEVFGWSFQDWGDDYSDTRASGVACGINAGASHRPAAPLAIIYVTGLTQAREKVMSAGGKISREIFSFPGGKRFHYIDPAGNELAVWSDK